jgi:hypothetical protein
MKCRWELRIKAGRGWSKASRSATRNVFQLEEAECITAPVVRREIPVAERLSYGSD